MREELDIIDTRVSGSAAHIPRSVALRIRKLVMWFV
jgi:hypothetical protein